MKILNKYEQLEDITPLCVALGSFDGVHKGHQKLLEVLKISAEAYGTKSMLYTFLRHPRKTTMPGKPIHYITNSTKRAEVLKSLGLDILYLEDFENVVSMSSEQFVKEILVAKLKVKCVIVGYNYRFGFKGEGSSEKLIELGKYYDFEVKVVPAVEIEGHVVSSSLIRHIIRAGNVERVPLYLGRSYSISGKVIHGKQNGTSMGIKTANLDINPEMTIPNTGVYITDTLIDGKHYKSLTNIGYNPTFKGERLTIESHLIGFENELYDKNIEIFILKRLRDEISFDTVTELVSQIKRDIDERLKYQAL